MPPLWPDVQTRWCIRHMGANFDDHFKNKDLKNMFKRLCIQNQQRKFNALWQIQCLRSEPVTYYSRPGLRHRGWDILPLESHETVWAAPGVSGAHRVETCQSPGPQVIMNELGSYIRVESNDSSWSTFVGCQGVACRAQLIGSPRCSRGWTNGNRQTSTWSIQQDHTQTAPLGLTSPGTYTGLGMAMPGTTWRH